jgi:hypothetical protein
MKRWLEYNFTADYFSEENSWTESTSPWTKGTGLVYSSWWTKAVVLCVGSPACGLAGAATRRTLLRGPREVEVTAGNSPNGCCCTRHTREAGVTTAASSGERRSTGAHYGEGDERRGSSGVGRAEVRRGPFIGGGEVYYYAE